LLYLLRLRLIVRLVTATHVPAIHRNVIPANAGIQGLKSIGRRPILDAG